MTFIAALRCDRIDAPFVFDQPINGASFTAWVEEKLCPTLGPATSSSSTTSPVTKGLPSGPQSGPEARAFCSSPYSPDLNPIEQVFAKFKHLLRKSAERTQEATWWHIGSLLGAFSPPRMPQLPQKLRICVNLMSTN